MKSSSKRPSLLSRSTKAKLSAAALAVTTLFTGLGITSCDNSTSPTNIPEPSHPDNIDYIPVNGRNIDIRVPASAGLTPEQKADLLTRLETALSHEVIAGHTNIDLLKIIEVTGFGDSTENFAGGIIRGKVPNGGQIIGWLNVALMEGFPVAYNSKTNTIHIASANIGNQRG